MVNETNIILSILLSCFVMLVMVMVIIVFVVIQKRKSASRRSKYELNLKNKELQILQTHIETQESEREKIARNMHDDIGPLVTSIKHHLSKYELMFDKSELRKQDLVAERKFVDVVLSHLRNTTHDLSPQFLLRNGLIKAFRSFIYEIEQIDVSFKENIDGSIAIPKEVELNSYRVLTELVNNIIRHDSPSKIDVEINLNKERLAVSISHDGKGIDNEDFIRLVDSSNGLGLSSLRARTTLLNASLDFQNDNFPTVIFTVPLNHEKND